MTEAESAIGFGLAFLATGWMLSALLGAAIWAAGPALRRRGPRAEQAAAAAGLVLPPLLAGATLLTLVGGSAVGFLGGGDHCPEHHLHLCLFHGAAWAGAPWAVVSVAVAATVVLARLDRMAASQLAARVARRRLEAAGEVIDGVVRARVRRGDRPGAADLRSTPAGPRPGAGAPARAPGALRPPLPPPRSRGEGAVAGRGARLPQAVQRRLRRRGRRPRRRAARAAALHDVEGMTTRSSPRARGARHSCGASERRARAWRDASRSGGPGCASTATSSTASCGLLRSRLDLSLVRLLRATLGGWSPRVTRWSAASPGPRPAGLPSRAAP
jgi:hypothetical protein